MKCPVCNNELTLLHTHIKVQDDQVDERTYEVHLCEKGGQWCNGLMVKHDIMDQKLTFITPAHTATTLHLHYVEHVSSEDLMKTIFTTFEYLAHVNKTR